MKKRNKKSNVKQTKKKAAKKAIKSGKPKTSGKNTGRAIAKGISKRKPTTKNKATSNGRGNRKKSVANTGSNNKSRSRAKTVFDVARNAKVYRGKNTVEYSINSKPDKIGNKLDGLSDSDKLKNQFKKSKVEPERAMIIITIEIQGEGQKVISHVTPNDFIVTPESVAEFANERLSNLLAEQSAFDYNFESSKIRIISVAVKLLF